MMSWIEFLYGFLAVLDLHAQGDGNIAPIALQEGETSLRQQRKVSKDLKAERQRMADAAWDG